MNHLPAWDIFRQPSPTLDGDMLPAFGGSRLGYELDSDALGRAGQANRERG